MYASMTDETLTVCIKTINVIHRDKHKPVDRSNLVTFKD